MDWYTRFAKRMQADAGGAGTSGASGSQGANTSGASGTQQQAGATQDGAGSNQQAQGQTQAQGNQSQQQQPQGQQQGQTNNTAGNSQGSQNNKAGNKREYQARTVSTLVNKALQQNMGNIVAQAAQAIAAQQQAQAGNYELAYQQLEPEYQKYKTMAEGLQARVESLAELLEEDIGAQIEGWPEWITKSDPANRRSGSYLIEERLEWYQQFKDVAPRFIQEQAQQQTQQAQQQQTQAQQAQQNPANQVPPPAPQAAGTGQLTIEQERQKYEEDAKKAEAGVSYF